MPISAVLTAPGQITLEDRPKQEPAKGEVVIAVEHAGVCGTDLALFKGDYPVPLPLVCGHEYVGRVVRTGPGVSSEWENQRVVAEITKLGGFPEWLRSFKKSAPEDFDVIVKNRYVREVAEREGLL